MSNAELHAFIYPTLEKLFSKEKQANHDLIHKGILEKNVRLGGSNNGFSFNGVIFSELPIRWFRKEKPPLLHQELHADMRKALDDEERIRKNVQKTKQIMILGLTDCETYQDARDALPNCLQVVVEEIANLPRTREVGYNLVHNPMLLKQYKSMVDDLEYLVASQLLY